MSLDANRRPSLSSFQFLVYVSGGFAMNLTNLVLSQWLYERFVIGGIVSTAAFSLILLAGRLTDGISDPFIAYWTDISYTRWGRRIPFLVFATLPLAIVCFLLWCPPVNAPETMRIIYAAAVCQGYFLLYGLVVTPYLALLPEIGNSPRERLNLTTGQGVATLVGTLVFALSGLIIQQFGYPALGLVLGLAVLISFYPITFVIREHPSSEQTKGSLSGLFRWMWEVLTNKDFLPLLIGTSLYWFALNLLLMLVPRWVEVQLDLSKEAVTWLMLPFIATNLVGFFFFNWLAKRIGKFASLMLVFALSGVVFCLFGWSDHLGIPVSPLICAQVVCGLAGLPVAGFGVLAFALLADVIDADAGRTGTRREAIYFGVQAILQKSMIGLSVVSFAQIEGALGPAGLRWIGIIAGLACLAGLICFSRYRLKAGGEELAASG
ncbi:MAG TPA: MFS transporter [Chthoniobacterales bacterium]|nr:MFS transporter [Chthoniobacterales bacterium]